jgi:Cu-Zn family superoxide dismutase
MKQTIILGILCVAGFALWFSMDLVGSHSPAAPPDAASHTAAAELKNRDGAVVGHARFIPGPQGVLINLTLTMRPSGPHAVHVHEVGRCDSPDFTSAGGHFNPTGREHGFLNAEGPHVGDLPNAHITTSGQQWEYFLKGAALDGGNGVLDADGAAIVVHAVSDDYRSDPAGEAGDRVACGVITADE